MPLTPGTLIDVYRVGELIGQGGMGEVYRATDTKLKREVAIKVLPASLSQNEEHLARFEREARILASLNHPNIASIFDLEEVDGGQALVLEIVDGPTLGDRIRRGGSSGTGPGLPLREALTAALQIASALDAAHDVGVVHRDLKPANVKFTASGEVKVLDFGLAKALASDPEPSPAPSQSPTRVFPTTAGMVIGTPAYMAPEQARGQAVDHRADIWAFGALLFEMLCGQPLFRGETSTDILAAVIGSDPDWSRLPSDTPVGIEHLLKRCLVHDARRRLKDIGEARFAIEDAIANPGMRIGERRRTHSSTRPWLWAGAAALALALAFFAGSRRAAPPELPAIHAELPLGDDAPLALGMRPSFTLAPDGSRLVVASLRGGDSRLVVHALDGSAPLPVAGTEGATGPFFSPDGAWLGFFADGRLKKVAFDGASRPIDLAPAPLAQGAAFARDGSVVFNPVHGEGLFRTDGAGGAAEPLSSVDRERGEAGHHWPHLLPDGDHVLMTVEQRGRPYSEAHIVLLSLETKEQRVLLEGGADARYVPSGGARAGGHLVFWRDGALWSAPFALDRLEVEGAPSRVVPDVVTAEPNGFAEYAFSSNGILVYLEGRHPLMERSLVQIDREGRESAITGELRGYERPRVSPDGTRIAVSIEAANGSLWTYELERGTLSRLTFDDENNRAAWAPDGERLAFASHRGGSRHGLVVATIDGRAAPVELRATDRPEEPESWSPDGAALLFTRPDPVSGDDVWVLPMDGDEAARPFLDSRFDESEARFSPNGGLVAYQSDESGRPEVYLRDFPGPGGKRQISVDGGTEPRWGRGGRELYYRRGRDVLVVDVAAGPSAPRVLFSVDLGAGPAGLSSWDAFPDGSRFLFIRDHAAPRTRVSLGTSWLRRLDATAPSSP